MKSLARGGNAIDVIGFSDPGQETLGCRGSSYLFLKQHAT